MIAGTAAVAALVIGGPQAALASVWGGATAILPMLVFGARLRIGPADHTAKAALSLFYKGELVKLSLTSLMCFAAVAVFGTQFVATILTFAACQVAYFIALAANW